MDVKDTYFHIPIQEQSRKYLRFHVQGQTYQFKALPFGLSTAPMEFTVLAKGVKLMAIHKGIRIHQYLNNWLVRAKSHCICLQHTQILVKLCQDPSWLVNVEKSELEPKEVFDFVGYQFDLRSGRVRTTPDRWQSLQDKIQALLLLPACPLRQFMSMIGLLTATEKQVHLGRLHMRPIQWHLKSNWSVPESLEKVIPIPRSLHPHLQWWLEETNVFQGQPLHPVKHALQIFTDASNEGWGAHLDERTARGSWSIEVFETLCSRWHRPQINQFAMRFINKLPQFVSPVLDPLATAVDALTLPWEDLDAYALPLMAILGKVVEKLQNFPCKRIILIAPGWLNMPWFWDLVTMSSQVPLSLPRLPNLLTQPFNQTPQKSDKSESPCMAPRASAIKKQGFSEAVAARIEAPQRRSTISIYEAKWTIFTKWCLMHQLDFRAPPVKSVADFLMYLFQDRKLQPSTIEGYRSAIADKLGNSSINISKDENLTHLQDSFHRDRPKGRRGIPSWNLSLVLHQLTKAAFEPFEEASLKHLTFKTVFLLALRGPQWPSG